MPWWRWPPGSPLGVRMRRSDCPAAGDATPLARGGHPRVGRTIRGRRQLGESRVSARVRAGARSAAAGAGRQAKLKPLPIPPPVAEPRYRPSAALAELVRCRDLTCRFPGCDAPAQVCDIDHTIPHPLGPTHPFEHQAASAGPTVCSAAFTQPSPPRFPAVVAIDGLVVAIPISDRKRCRRNRGFRFGVHSRGNPSDHDLKGSKNQLPGGSVVGCWLGCRRYLPPQALGNAPAAM